MERQKKKGKEKDRKLDLSNALSENKCFFSVSYFSIGFTQLLYNNSIRFSRLVCPVSAFRLSVAAQRIPTQMEVPPSAYICY